MVSVPFTEYLCIIFIADSKVICCMAHKFTGCYLVRLSVVRTVTFGSFGILKFMPPTVRCVCVSS